MPPAEPSPVAEPAALAELRALVHQAERGDTSVLPRIRQILAAHGEIRAHVADLEKIVLQSWIRLLGADPLTAEAIKCQAEQLRQELEGASLTPLERLLVGQVVACWLELKHAQLPPLGPDGKSHSQSTLALKRVESVQRRFLASIKTLVTLRGLVPGGFLSLHELRLARAAQQEPAGSAGPAGDAAQLKVFMSATSAQAV